VRTSAGVVGERGQLGGVAPEPLRP
jgi:hypothetical protein